MIVDTNNKRMSGYNYQLVTEPSRNSFVDGLGDETITAPRNATAPTSPDNKQFQAIERVLREKEEIETGLNLKSLQYANLQSRNAQLVDCIDKLYRIAFELHRDLEVAAGSELKQYKSHNRFKTFDMFKPNGDSLSRAASSSEDASSKRLSELSSRLSHISTASDASSPTSAKFASEPMKFEESIFATVEEAKNNKRLSYEGNKRNSMSRQSSVASSHTSKDNNRRSRLKWNLLRSGTSNDPEAAALKEEEERKVLPQVSPKRLPHISVNVHSVLQPMPKMSKSSFVTGKDEAAPVVLTVYDNETNDELWRIKKDFNSLLGLEEQIRPEVSQYGISKLPERQLFTSQSPSRVDVRRNKLSKYFNQLMNVPLLPPECSNYLSWFLSTNIVTPNQSEVSSESTKEGYLSKRGRSFGGWKVRYFVLSMANGPYLNYYDRPNGEFQGTIALFNSTITSYVPQNPNGDTLPDNEYRHAFVLMESKKLNEFTSHVFCAETDQERDAWLDAMKGFVELPAYCELPNNKTHQSQSKRQSYQQNVTVLDQAKRMSRTSEKDKSSSDEEDGNKFGKFFLRKSKKEVVAPFPGETADHKGDSIKGALSYLMSHDDTSSSSGSSSSESSDDSNDGKRIFSVHLKESLDLSSRVVDDRFVIPTVVYRILEFLQARRAVAEEGIFRRNGSSGAVRNLRHRFNIEHDVDLLETDTAVNSATSLLKLYLREVSGSFIPPNKFKPFKAHKKEMDKESRMDAVQSMLNGLDKPELDLLAVLFGYLVKVAENHNVNKMTARNLAIVFEPTLKIPQEVIELIISEYDAFFLLK